MLRSIRRHQNSAIIKGLFAILAATFVVWGAGMYGASQVNAIAEVYDARITDAALARETALIDRRLRELTQGAAMQGVDLRSQALNQLVETALIEHEAEQLGLEVTEGDLIATITTMPELQRDGRFDRALLERVLDLQRDRGEFETEVRQSILARRFRDLVIDGVQVSPAEVEAEYRSQNEQVSLRYARFPAAEAAKDLTFTTDELEKHRTDHRDRYMGPPTTRARYVVLRPGDYTDVAAPSPAEIEAHYEAHKADRFTKPETVQARHMLVRLEPGATDDERAAARKRAEDLLRRVKAGEDFAELARKSSDDVATAARGGDLGSFGRGRMTPAFEQAAFALSPGGVSDVVETPFGFHVIKLEARDPGGVQELAAVRDTIVAELSRERGAELARSEADQIRRAVVGGKPLAEAAGKRPLAETGPFPESGLVPGIGRAPVFAKAAFALGDGQVSDLVEEGEAIYILEPFERRGPELPALDQIRERVEADARRAAGEVKAREKAQALLARAREVGLEAAAKEAGIELQRTEPFARRAGAIPALGAVPGLSEAAFTLTAAAPLAPDVYVAGGDAIVAALAERTAADMARFAQEKAGLEARLLDRKRRAAWERYLDGLKKRAVDDGALLVRADALGPR